MKRQSKLIFFHTFNFENPYCSRSTSTIVCRYYRTLRSRYILKSTSTAPIRVELSIVQGSTGRLFPASIKITNCWSAIILSVRRYALNRRIGPRLKERVIPCGRRDAGIVGRKLERSTGGQSGYTQKPRFSAAPRNFNSQQTPSPSIYRILTSKTTENVSTIQQ